MARQTLFSTRFSDFIPVPPALISGLTTRMTLTTMISLTSAKITLAMKKLDPGHEKYAAEVRPPNQRDFGCDRAKAQFGGPDDGYVEQ